MISVWKYCTKFGRVGKSNGVQEFIDNIELSPKNSTAFGIFAVVRLYL